jgi:hypothetical protein
LSSGVGKRVFDMKTKTANSTAKISRCVFRLPMAAAPTM